MTTEELAYKLVKTACPHDYGKVHCPACAAEAIERVKTEERFQLIPMLCQRCHDGKEKLVKSPSNRYSHQRKVGDWLDSCEAHALHQLLGTRAEMAVVNRD